MESSYYPAFYDKVINPDLAIAALHGTETHGEFKAFVRLAEPDKHPNGMKVMEINSDMLNVLIRCDQIEHVVNDRNVLSVELREYVCQGRSTE